jgi:hypothetical protein
LLPLLLLPLLLLVLVQLQCTWHGVLEVLVLLLYSQSPPGFAAAAAAPRVATPLALLQMQQLPYAVYPLAHTPVAAGLPKC